MNLNQLYYFKTIASLQHFRNAAQELHISQPSLSYSMSSLEEELGTKLFEKQGRNIYLTKYGKVFLNYVTQALDTLEIGQDKVKRLTSSTKGYIDIAYVATLSSFYIPKTVRNFLDINEYKNINFTFKQGITTSIVEGLKSSEYDIGFCSQVEDEPTISFEPILEQEMVVIVPLNHPLAKFNSVNLSDISTYPIVAYNRGSGLSKFVLKLFQSENITPNIIFEGDDENSLYGLVAENFGVSVVANTPQLNNFKVKKLSINNLTHKRYIYMAYMKDRYFPPAVISFINYINSSKLHL